MTLKERHTLEAFITDGAPMLRRGVGNPQDQRRIMRRTRHVVSLLDSLKLSNCVEDTERATLVESRWIASDLCDRCGDYPSAERCLGEREAVARLYESFPSPKKAGDFKLFCSLHMFQVLLSVAHHRTGDRIGAARMTERLQKRLDRVIRDQERREQDERVLLWTDHLGWRTAYATGRHCLSNGDLERAEHELGRALEFCASSRRRSVPGVSEADLVEQANACLLWTGTIMTALSRASLEQGRLERAARQLLVSGTILRSTQDQIGVGFSDYLLGCVYRQMGDWAKSIAHLTVATERFRDLRHERYLRRTLFELTKSYLLKKDWDGAQQSLASAKGLGEQMLFRENTATRKRSEAVGELLFARVKFATGEIAEAEACIQSCWAQIATLGADIKAQAHIIRGEILLWQKKFSSSIRECETGLRLKPADVTDRAWLILIAAEAHLRRGDLDGAKQWFSQWEMLAKEIENQILRERALKLESALDAEKASFYISYADPSEFTYEKVNQDLRRFLVQHVRAFKHGESQEEQARALGISRQTYSNWLAELRDANLLVD